jgi:hypothetical protein
MPEAHGLCKSPLLTFALVYFGASSRLTSAAAREETGHDRLALKDLRALGVGEGSSDSATAVDRGNRSGQAHFIIATQRSRCADKPVVLIDEVKRFDRTFAWVYARPAENK